MTEFLAKKDMPAKWLYDYFNPFEIHKHAIKGTVFCSQSKIQEIVVAESVNFGKCLVLDNEVQSAEKDEFIYHEALVQPAMILHPRPQCVAILGGGEGAALREALRHKSIKKAVMIDIDGEVMECARKYLPSMPAGAFDDPRTELHTEDARKYMENTQERFDVVVIDLTCPLEGGPSSMLFTQEFYSIVKDKLLPQGLVSVQADTTSIVALHTYTTINNTLKQVFPEVFPYVAFVPFYSMLWGFSLATQGLNPLELSRDEIDRRITQRVEGELRYYDGTAHQALFNLPKYLRKAVEKETRVNRDSAPIKEKYPGFKL